MFTDIAKHPYHYFALLVLMGIHVAALLLLPPLASMREAVIISFSVWYVIWGILHHHLVGNLHLTIVIEYVLLALLTVFIGLSF